MSMPLVVSSPTRDGEEGGDGIIVLGARKARCPVDEEEYEIDVVDSVPPGEEGGVTEQDVVALFTNNGMLLASFLYLLLCEISEQRKTVGRRSCACSGTACAASLWAC